MEKLRIALIGNPNVGKSTVYNALTGEKQHTGNWSGKTVDSASACAVYNNKEIEITDLPGAYSLTTKGNEEEITGKTAESGNVDILIAVCDACVLERNLLIVLQALSFTKNVILCVNMVDEAEKKHIKIDTDKLSTLLGIPVVMCSAKRRKGIDILLKTAVGMTPHTPCNVTAIKEITEETIQTAHKICVETVTVGDGVRQRDKKIDRILTGKFTALPFMLLLLVLILFITLYGANYPSEWLMWLFSKGYNLLCAAFEYIHAPAWLSGLIADGIYKTVAWVVAVMLPPMAIFFPLFTLLEDVGYLPRIAFNTDRFFRCSGACGKQALTTCMGFGCNSVGVTGCRIIESERERRIAQLTNSFIPCNGKFPTLIAIISMFIVSGGGIVKNIGSALLLTLLIVASVVVSLAVSKLLSETYLSGSESSFVLELPPYRMPDIGRVIVNSIKDRTLFVLGRAVCVAVPAGALIWMLGNIHVEDVSLLQYISQIVDPIGRFLGLDGVILIAFILGFPANEIVVPIIIMAYSCRASLTDFSSLEELQALLTANGWTIVTAVCAMLFSVFHWPCSTTCITLYKETRSIRDTLLAVAMPTAFGIFLCAVIGNAAKLFM